jgi:hypothetical protein
MRTLQVRLLLRQGLPDKPLEHAQTHVQGTRSFATPSRQFCYQGWTCHHRWCCYGGNEKWKADLRREAINDANQMPRQVKDDEAKNRAKGTNARL